MGPAFNVFVCWSGERSRIVAQFLRGWLPKVIQTAVPWMSEMDVEKGSRWFEEVAGALDSAKVGICCLTPENLKEAWLLFESGALSKSIRDRTRVCTYLLGGLQPQDIRPPLSLFQATRAERDDTRRLIHTINQAVNEHPVPRDDLNDIFDAMWGKLEQALASLPNPERTVEAKRSVDDMVAEILEFERARAIERKKVEHLDALLPFLSDLQPLFEELARAVRLRRREAFVGTAPSASPSTEAVSVQASSVPSPATVPDAPQTRNKS